MSSECNEMNDRLNELLSGKLRKSPAVLNEFASIIGKQYINSEAEADLIWQSIINKYGENEYYFSVLRMRNGIARVLGMKEANDLLMFNIDRVKKLLSATKGSKAFKIYEFCSMLIKDGHFDKAVQLIMCLDDFDGYFENVEKVIYYLQRDVRTKELQTNNLEQNSEFSYDEYVDRDQVNVFMKMCSNRFAEIGLKGIGEKWYYNDLNETNQEKMSTVEEIDISNVRGLFPEIDPEMASVVLEVANDCYDEEHCRYGKTHYSISFSFDFSSIIDDILIQEMKKLCPEMSSEEIEKFISEIREDQEKQEAFEKAKREKLKSEIKEKIQGNSKIGWKIAYQLCGTQDTKTTRLVRYQLVDNLPELSIKERISIREKYLGDLINNDTTSSCLISTISREIVELILISDDDAYVKDIDKYYELACRYAENEEQVIEKLLDIKKRFK